MPFVQHGRPALLRRLAIGGGVAAALIAGIRFARNTPPITTVSDIAVIELYTDLATKGRLLVGPYSRFGWHHPGPLYFYLQAPLYALSGHRAAALYIGALAMNLTALILLTTVIARENRGWLLALVTAAAVVFAWRTPRLLASPWTAHVPVLPTITFLALCAATASREPRLLPLTIAVGSFVVQSHIGFAPIVVTLTAATVAAVFARRRDYGRTVRPVLIVSALVCLLLWLIPIIEGVSHAGGNFAALWAFFVAGGGQAHSMREAALAWSYGLAGTFRADFALPWGGHFVPAIPQWVVACSIAEVLLLPVIGAIDLKAGRRFEGNLAMASFVACSTGLWALTRVRDDILDHEIFWLAALGLINVAIIAAAGLRTLARMPGSPATARVAAIFTLLAAAAIGVRDIRSSTAYELSRLDRQRIVTGYSSIHDYLHERGVRRPLIHIDAAVWSQAAGILVRLQHDGICFALPPDAVPLFTDRFAATGAEDAQIWIASRTPHRELMSRPDNTVVLEADPVYIDAVRARP